LDLTSDARRGTRERAKPRGRDRVIALVAPSIGADAKTLERVDQSLGAQRETRARRQVIFSDLHHLGVVDELAGHLVAGRERPGVVETSDDRVQFVSEPTFDMPLPHHDPLNAHSAPRGLTIREMAWRVKHSDVPIFGGKNGDEARRAA